MGSVEPLAGATLVAVVALLLNVLTLWMTRWVWIIAIASVVVTGYVAGVMHGPAALWLLALAASVWTLRTQHTWRRVIGIGATVVLGLLLGLHLLPGFANPIVIRQAVLSPGAIPYSQYVNFDKTLGAVLLLGLSGWTPIRSLQDWTAAVRRAAPVTLITVIVVMTASLAIGFAQGQPRWSPLFGVWAVVNLLTTCVSEEAFFRGFIQKEIGDRIGLLASAVLFGLAHLAGGWTYVGVAALAGIGYASVYWLTARVEMSIVTHFIVNAVHFLLFTYPSLA